MVSHGKWDTCHCANSVVIVAVMVMGLYLRSGHHGTFMHQRAVDAQAGASMHVGQARYKRYPYQTSSSCNLFRASSVHVCVSACCYAQVLCMSVMSVARMRHILFVSIHIEQCNYSTLPYIVGSLA
jgi:hypothetical protein